jgi:uncharacterized membrane protein
MSSPNARLILMLGFAYALLGGRSAIADDNFSLCNRTNLNVVYAKALNTGTSPKEILIESEGWFQLAPGECAVLWPGKLSYRYYLIYAEARGSNRKWSGDKHICTADAAFKITGGPCRTDQNHRLFIQVDTGDFNAYTYDLN